MAAFSSRGAAKWAREYLREFKDAETNAARGFLDRQKITSQQLRDELDQKREARAAEALQHRQAQDAADAEARAQAERDKAASIGIKALLTRQTEAEKAAAGEAKSAFERDKHEETKRHNRAIESRPRSTSTAAPKILGMSPSQAVSEWDELREPIYDKYGADGSPAPDAQVVDYEFLSPEHEGRWNLLNEALLEAGMLSGDEPEAPEHWKALIE